MKIPLLTLVCVFLLEVSAQELGQWSPLINLPIVPMAAAVLPKTNQLLLWSAAKADSWTLEDPNAKYTQFSTIDLDTLTVSQRTVSETGHDMFCPGITLDADGRLIVSGGSTATPVSSYNVSAGQWTRLAELNIPRGYHSTAITSERRIFTIGGSWSGGFGGKVGELYDPTTNAWNLLPGCDVNAILTDDAEGIYRSDNHAALFTWKDASIFHAGPSKAMQWFDTRGSGRTLPAGLRAHARDAMCAVAVMYDTGKILFTAGAPDYNNSLGLDQTYEISIDSAYSSNVRVEKVASLKLARALSNGVVLPDGQVLVTGGQRFAHIFTDNDAVLTPELYNPATKTWRSMAVEPKPRTYHALSILLPDATVFSGGGGACGDCAFNHFDGAIFKPPYLFTNGQLAVRPQISAVSSTKVTLGSSVSITVAGAGLSFAFVRIGTVTHSTNTDQRRLSVTPSSASGDTYVLPVPADAGVAPAGFWYIFAISSQGVPSVARVVQFTTDAAVTPIQKNNPDVNRPCPGATSASSTFTAKNGEIYAVCANANFNNRKDLANAGNVPSIEECSAMCSRTARCTMVTYLPGPKQCYMKYGQLSTTTTSPGWTSSIKIRARPCPNNAAVSQVTTSSDGRIYGVCAGADFPGANAYFDNAVSSPEICAESCSKRADCLAAIWMQGTSNCWMKTTLEPSKSDSRFTSVLRMQFSPCLGKKPPSTTFTASDGDIYGVCQGQDFYGSDLSNRGNVASGQACAQACAETAGCTSATYIGEWKTCYMKDRLPTAQAWSGREAIFRIGIQE